MRSIKYLFLFLIIISCNSDEPEETIIDYSKILVQESPWILDRVEIIEIEGEDGYVFSQSEIEEIAQNMKDHANGYLGTFEFYNDGSGLWNSEYLCPNCEITYWVGTYQDNEVQWAHNAFIHTYYIESNNQINELIRPLSNGEGPLREKKIKRLSGKYVWN